MARIRTRVHMIQQILSTISRTVIKFQSTGSVAKSYTRRENLSANSHLLHSYIFKLAIS